MNHRISLMMMMLMMQLLLLRCCTIELGQTLMVACMCALCIASQGTQHQGCICAAVPCAMFLTFLLEGY
uniref:Putative secreted protein n=1 Tax=Anopheles triannulatus TaxID=58253 RepID=A0A2M4B791_9DIPT